MWSFQYGKLRGGIAVLCRMIWLIPVFAGLFPQSEMKKKTKNFRRQSIHVLIDDSKSMEHVKKQVENRLDQLNQECVRAGCRLSIQKLSQLTGNNQALSFLNKGLESWFFQVGSDPWMMISDASDAQPSIGWNQGFKGVGGIGSDKRGLILYPESKQQNNYLISNIDSPPFAFESQGISIAMSIKRTSVDEKQTVQLIVQSDGKRLSTENVTFSRGQTEVDIALETPPLSRGQHLLQFDILPTRYEKVLWDNRQFRNVEVMPNTVGVLHLLGAPSWDGRFLRRYFKSEPKYDLISFFILRDPWDSQQVNERELSLIPFPVSKLFNEELPNFRVIVLQNFSLLQFLLPEYQKNLVSFVKNGGGLLFLGGGRSLVDGDLYNSPLKDILPFRSNNTQSQFAMGLDSRVNTKGPWYDADLKYRIRFANPTSHQKALADVFTTWQKIYEPLQAFDGGKGLHHMENVSFRDGEYTPLLNAHTAKGEIPLAVASYPGKGRALWLFSDSMWKLGFGGESISRTVYSSFVDGAMKWLLRREISQPMTISQVELKSVPQGLAWVAQLRGPAVRYLQPQNNWQLSICGVKFDKSKVVFESLSLNEKKLKGKIPVHLRGGDRCKIEVKAQHDAFGSTKTSMAAVFPDTLEDDVVGFSEARLQQLIQLTNAESYPLAELRSKDMQEWLAKSVQTESLVDSSEFEWKENPFWIFKFQWVWLLLCFLPLEVVARKWDRLAHQS